MKFIKKQIDFSKGEINELLTERTDIGILDKSAKYIKNFYPSIFGTLKNRKGTKKIDILQDIGGKIENPTITSPIAIDNNYFDDNNFVSDSINDNTILFQIEADEENKIKNFSIENLYLIQNSKILQIKPYFSVLMSFGGGVDSGGWKLNTLEILDGGSNYTDPNNIIEFQIEDKKDYEVLPVVQAILEGGVVKNINILDGGKIESQEKLKIIVKSPDFISLDVKIQVSDDKNLWQDVENITLTSTITDYFLSLPNYYRYIRITRLDDNIIDTKIVLQKFIFSIGDPNITSYIGGNIEDLINSNGNFTSDLFKRNQEELIVFRFNSIINIFSLNNVKLASLNNAEFKVNVFYENVRDKKTHTFSDPDYRSITTTYISSISILNSGSGYKPNTTYNLLFVPNVGPGNKYPQATATTDENGVFYKVDIVNNAYYKVYGSWSGNSNPSALFSKQEYSIVLNDNEYFNIEVMLQGKEEESSIWKDIEKFEIDKILSRNLLVNVDNLNYRDFRLKRVDNYDYNASIQISSFLASGNIPIPAKQIKLIDFEFKDFKYLIALCNGYIEIFKDNKLISILKNSKLTSDIIHNIKYSQYDNRLVLVHPDLPPQELKIDKDNYTFSIEDFYIYNIPLSTINGESTTIIDPYLILTPSDIEGTINITSNYDFFNESMLNQYIDGNTVSGGKAKIIKIISSKEVKAEVVIPFYDSTPFNNFWLITGYEQVWSEKRGYPSTCLFYQNRLWFGGSKSKPFSFWGSRINSFNDFNNIYNNDNEAIIVDILSKEYEEIKHIIANKGIQIFTNKNEYVAQDNTLTPNGINISKVSSVGIDSNIQPITMLSDTLFIDKNKKALNRLTNSSSSDMISLISTSVLSILNSNLIKNPISITLDYSNIDGDGNFVYIVNDDGAITIGNILLEDSVSSFTRFEFNNGNVKDVLLSNNNIYFVIERQGVLYLEVLDKTVYSDLTIKKNIIKDDENENIKINDLYEYEDQEVMVYNDTLDFNFRFKVVDGSVVLPYSYFENVDLIPNIINVGFVIDSELISNDIQVNNETNTKIKRIAVAEITTTNNSKGFNLNETYLNKAYKVLNEDFLFKKLGVGNWNSKVFFRISSDFGNLEIKSIVLTINI